MRTLIIVAGSIALLALPASSRATQLGHDRFASDPYPDNWCGVAGTAVDYVLANYMLDGSGTSLNILTTFTATAGGKSMEIRQAGHRTQVASLCRHSRSQAEASR